MMLGIELRASGLLSNRSVPLSHIPALPLPVFVTLMLQGLMEEAPTLCVPWRWPICSISLEQTIFTRPGLLGEALASTGRKRKAPGLAQDRVTAGMSCRPPPGLSSREVLPSAEMAAQGQRPLFFPVPSKLVAGSLPHKLTSVWRKLETGTGELIPGMGGWHQEPRLRNSHDMCCLLL